MANDRFDIPHALKMAYRDLKSHLCDAKDQWNSHAGREYSISTDLLNAAVQFVYTFRIEPRWEAELLARATLVERRCSDDHFRQLLAETKGANSEPPERRDRLRQEYAEGLEPTLKLDSNVLLSAGLSELIADMDQSSSDPACQEVLGPLLAAAYEIAGEAKYVEADGCAYLYALFRSRSDNPPARDQALAGILRTSSFCGPNLEVIERAADSLIKWAGQQPPADRATALERLASELMKLEGMTDLSAIDVNLRRISSPVRSAMIDVQSAYGDSLPSPIAALLESLMQAQETTVDGSIVSLQDWIAEESRKISARPVKRKKQQGKKQQYDPERDQRIAEAWQRASDEGTRKVDFAASYQMKVSDLNKLLARERKRRADPRRG